MFEQGAQAAGLADFAAEAGAVRAMVEIYGDLDDAAAGEHGRAALSYRRAAFLESAGQRDQALSTYLALFEKTPNSGALSRSIERLAMPFLVMSQTIPKVAIAPIILVWFGLQPRIAEYR